MKALERLILVTTMATLLAAPAAAGTDAISVLTGFGKGNLMPPQPDYEFAHLGVSFEHRADGWCDEHLGWDPPGEWYGFFLPYLGVITEPENNIEVSCAVGARGVFPVDHTWRPYIYGGGGPVYTTQSTLEQSTKLNFGSFAGYGMEYRFEENRSISLHYTIRHLSNAGIDDPNDGIDINAWAVAYTVYLD